MNLSKAALDHRRMGDYYRRIGQWRKANREYEKADALDTAKTIKREMTKTHRQLRDSLIVEELRS